MSEVIACPVGTTSRKQLIVALVDEYLAPIDISGCTVRLQGTSADLPAKKLDVVGAVYDGPNGLAKWTAVGNLVSATDLGALASALYTCRVKVIDAASKADWGPEFQLTFVAPPAVS